METWQSNLLFSWVAQFFSIMGFGFALPFAPFYLQELGVTGEAQINFWTGLFASVAGVTMAIMAPIWGYLADRIGKKPMTLRASLGGAFVMVGMAFAQSPAMLLVFRLLQGVFTGTVTAYLTLVVTSTPKERMGLAIGVMNSAVFFGNSVSPLLGGLFADLFGYRASFLVAAGLLFMSFLLSLIFVHESVKPETPPAFSLFADLRALLSNAGVVALIGMLSIYAFSQNIQKPLLPLVVQDLVATARGLATQAGIVNSAGGVASILAGILIGAIADRGRTLKIGVACALTGSVFVFLMAFVAQVWQLILLSFLFAFFSGGLEPILKVLLVRIVPVEKRGAAFGLTASASASGWATGALGGGACAAMLGLHSIFVVSAVFFVGIAGLLMLFGRGKDY